MAPKGKARKERGRKRTAKCPNTVPKDVTIKVNNEISKSLTKTHANENWFEKLLIMSNFINAEK